MRESLDSEEKREPHSAPAADEHRQLAECFLISERSRSGSNRERSEGSAHPPLASSLYEHRHSGRRVAVHPERQFGPARLSLGGWPRLSRIRQLRVAASDYVSCGAPATDAGCAASRKNRNRDYELYAVQDERN